MIVSVSQALAAVVLSLWTTLFGVDGVDEPVAPVELRVHVSLLAQALDVMVAAPVVRIALGAPRLAGASGASGTSGTPGTPGTQGTGGTRGARGARSALEARRTELILDIVVPAPIRSIVSVGRALDLVATISHAPTKQVAPAATRSTSRSLNLRAHVCAR